MMKQVCFNVFVFLSILTLSSSQNLLYHCDFDTGLINSCRFTKTPGAPDLENPDGIASISAPTQPLSDVKSITSLTTPNNELCSLPHIYPPDTWETNFCRQNSATNYTCQTTSGTGNCMIGRYGLIKTNRNGAFDQMYTSVNTVQNYLEPFQCLDFHYYMINDSFRPHIDVTWTAGAGPFEITGVDAQRENKWHHHRYTYKTPPHANYYIRFVMLRDGGIAGFAFALDEIKIFDGPCESPTTSSPDTTFSNEQITSIETTTSSSPTNGISANISTGSSPTIKQTFQSMGTDVNPSASLSSSAAITTQLLLSNTTAQTLLPSAETSTIDISSTPNTVSTSSRSTTSTITSTTTPFITSTKKSDLPLILGLTLGLGLPSTLLIIGALVYYCKIIRPRQKIRVRSSNEVDIPMT